MKKIASFLLLLSVAAAFAASEESLKQQVDAAPGGKIVVDVDFGSVDLSAGDDGRVVLDAVRKIDFGDEKREKDYLAATPIRVTKEGNTVTIRSRRDRNNNDSWRRGRRVSTDGRYSVRVPKKFDVEVRTSGGAVEANGLTGTIKADTKGGKLRFEELRGPIDARTSGGDVRVRNCEGEVEIGTSGGGMEFVGGSGKLNARTSGGSVTIENRAGDIDIRTSGGSLTLENINGRLNGRTSGGSIFASLASPVAGDVDLDTSAGSIDLAVPPDAGLSVDARASVGKVSSDLPFSGARENRERLNGTINGGGKSVTLRAGSGSINIRPRQTHAAAKTNP